MERQPFKFLYIVHFSHILQRESLIMLLLPKGDLTDKDLTLMSEMRAGHFTLSVIHSFTSLDNEFCTPKCKANSHFLHCNRNLLMKMCKS